MEQKNLNVCDVTEALVLTGFGKFNILITILSGAVVIALMLESIGFGFVIGASQCDLDLSVTDKGILGGTPLIGFLVGSQIWGYLADTRGRRKILMISMISGSTCSMISSLSPNFISLIILKFSSAFLLSAQNAVLFAYYGEVIPKTHVTMMISIVSTISVSGPIFGTGMAWAILTLDFNIPLPLLGIVYRPWRLLILCFASLFMIVSLGMYHAPDSPKYLMSQGKKEEVLIVLKKIYTWNTGKDPSTYPVDDISIDEQDCNSDSDEKKSVLQSILDQVVPLFKPPLLYFSFVTFVLGYAALGCVNPFNIWLPEIMDRFYLALEHDQADGKTICEIMNFKNEIDNISMSHNNNTPEYCDDTFEPGSYPMLMLLSTLFTIGNIIISVLLKFYPKKIILIAILCLSCFSVFLLNFIKNYYISWILTVFFQMNSASSGIIKAYIVELFPTQYRAMALSFMLLFGRIGGIVGTNLFGYFLEVNCYANFYFFGFILLLCVLIAFLLPNAHKKKNSDVT